MSVWSSIKRYFKHHPFILILCLICIVLFTLLSLVPPQILKLFIDEGLVSKDKSLMLQMAILYFLTFLVMNIFNFGKGVLTAIISQGISKTIRLDMLKKVNRLDYVSFTKFDAGTLEAYFSNDVDSIDQLITSGVISFTIDLFRIFGIVISVFFYSWLFGVITIASIPIIFVIVWILKNKMMRVQLKNRKLEGNVNNSILENLENIQTIKSYRVYDNITKRYDQVLNNHYITAEKTNLYDAILSPIIQMLKGIIIAIIVCIASYDISWFGMSIGAVVAGIDYITDIFQPVEKLGDEIQTIQKSLAGIKRISEFFKLPMDKIKDRFVDGNDFVLEFRDVTYSYDNKVNVIENFNLVLKGNDHLTLEGRSGAGKSTLFKLAYGMLEPQKGSVTINGIPSYLLNEETRQRIFGIVYQDYFFTNKTIYEEVTLERKNISHERVFEVLKSCGLGRIDDIDKLLVTTDYSSGELSLFNIARAILLDGKILFLDEMNAKIDTITASKIIDVINEIGKDKMILSINHYGSLIENSKVLYVGE
ncbi:MAG: ABC transporter ATP-binding protein [Anaeroplasmataceae bacterium]